jgi:uncharacterized protein HemY
VSAGVVAVLVLYGLAVLVFVVGIIVVSATVGPWSRRRAARAARRYGRRS